VEEEEPVHFIRRWVSFGDIITLIASLLVFSFGYGSLSKDVEQVKVQLAAIQNRDITPGAAVKISSLEVKVSSIEREAQQQRDDAADYRAQIREQLNRIEAKIDAHMDGGRRQ